MHRAVVQGYASVTENSLYQGLLTLIESTLLPLKKRQSRREESRLVIPNKRRATGRGAFSGATLFSYLIGGLRLFFRPAALSFAHVERLHLAHSALLDEKIVSAGSIQLVLTGPRLALRNVVILPAFIRIPQ